MASIRSSVSAFLLGLPTALAAGLFVSHYNGNIYSLNYEAPGTLTVKQTLKACGGMPSWLTLDGKGENLYCTDESGAGRGSTLTQLSVSDGSVKVSGTSRTGGGELHSCLYGGADGQGFIAAAEYDPSSISTWKLPLSSSTSTVQHMTFTMNGRGPVPSRQDKPHPHSVFTDPTGKYLMSADLGADLIRIFSIDADSGKLTQCTNAATGPGDGPRHPAWWAPKAGSTDGQMLYIVNELGNSVSVWKVTYPATGCLTLSKVQTISAYAAGKSAPQGSKSAEVHVFGNNAYVVNRNDKSFGATSDSVATYAIDPATGQLQFLESTNAYTYYPRTFQINKDGTLLAIAGQTSSTVAIVERNTTTGRLGSKLASLLVGTPGSAGNEDGLSAVIWNEVGVPLYETT